MRGLQEDPTALPGRTHSPVPRTDESLDALGGSKVFSTLDLEGGYYQVAMEERDKPKKKAENGFHMPIRSNQFERMLFGLANVPATFQRLMNPLSTFSQFYLSILTTFSFLFLDS